MLNLMSILKWMLTPGAAGIKVLCYCSPPKEKEEKKKGRKVPIIHFHLIQFHVTRVKVNDLSLQYVTADLRERERERELVPEISWKRMYSKLSKLWTIAEVN
uniref:Uncharacterized protein n=1 Tax=Cacopsylla melanoneura TaxID=428564 RepID=A0A8D8XMG8_9HEMI